MDYNNYDAYGNKINSAAPSATHQQQQPPLANTTSSVKEISTGRGRQGQDSDSDGWDDVEVITNQVPAEDISVPLVQAAPLSGQVNQPQHGDQLLLLTGGPSSSSSAGKSEQQKLAESLSFVAATQSKIRNICLVGDLHSGKSSIARLLSGPAAEGLFDELSEGKTPKQRHFGTSSSSKNNTNDIPFQLSSQEADRLISLRTSTYTCIVSGEKTQTSHLINISDTPGHPNFMADTLAAVRVSDTTLVCVDASLAVGSHTEQIIQRAVLQGIRIVLVLTKLDRLFVDLHLPPQDCYLKLRLIIDTVNNIIASCGGNGGAGGESQRDVPLSPLVTPINNTVWFTSAKMDLFFTVETFARRYSEAYKNINVSTLASRLWGAVRYDTVNKKFTKISNPTQRASFVTMVLEPLYKIISHSVGGKGFELLNEYLKENPKTPWLAVREAITLHCGSFHRSAIDSLLSACESPARRTKHLREQYQVAVDDEEKPITCFSAVTTSVLYLQNGGAHSDSKTPSSGTASSQNPSQDGNVSSILVQCRIINGLLKPNDELLIVSQDTSEDTDVLQGTVEAIFVRMGVGLVQVSEATVGMTVFLKGLGNKIRGSHSLLVANQTEQAFAIPTIPSVFDGLNKANKKRSLQLHTAALDSPLMHLSVEPVLPNELKRFEAGVRKMVLRYPGMNVSIEDTAAYTISGTGELQFEAALTDLRRFDCSTLNIKTSQPFVTFSETVAEPRGILATYPPHGSIKDQLAMTAHKLPDKLRDAVEHNILPLEDPVPLFTCLRKEYGWDISSARRSILSIGPDMTKGGSNILVDDSIEGMWLEEEDSARAVVQGFLGATTHGPLCSAEVRGVHFKLIGEPVPFSSRLVQHARRCAHLAMLGANPRLMEPVLAAEIITQPSHVEKLKGLLQIKRGNFVSETNIPASSLVVCKAFCPATDHFGLETQMRAITGGEAFPTFAFDHWADVPGDPYDASVRIGLLEPARGYQLARDFVLKTRQRKGLRGTPEDVDV